MDERDNLDGVKLMEFIRQHEREKILWKELENQYLSKPEILYGEEKEAYKPDNRLVANFGRYLVLNFNGYFVGLPTKVHHSDEKLNKVVQDFWKLNDMDNVIDELGKLSSIFGKAYLIMYQDEDAQTKVAYSDPYDIFLIHTNHIKPSTLYGVRYHAVEGGYEGEIYDSEGYQHFLLVDDELLLETPTNAEGKEIGQTFYGRVPIVEFIHNEERQSLIEPVATFIDGFNKALSEKANDVDYFADAYLAILGAELDENKLPQIRDNRILNVHGSDVSKIDVKFLEKPNADETQENLLDRLERLIYTLSMVTNTSEEVISTSGVASGEALKVKQQGMSNLAISKERKFESALQTMFGMMFNVLTNVDSSNRMEYNNIEYTWRRNTPRNISEEVEVVRSLEGVVSKHTQLTQLSLLDDVEAEKLRLDEENEPDPVYDFQKSGDA